jgi:polysaccharide export outer membrane protein
MRPVSLFVVALFAAAVGGCASLSTGADVPAASAADLDSLAYARPVSSALPQAQAQSQVTPALAFAAELPYTLDTGDKLRVVVFGQDGLSNSYVVDAGGAITMPLIKAVPARGLTTAALARAVGDRLRQGFVREPHVAIEVEAYRPFFILGEVTAPGQYAYVPQMTVEKAVAVAGGFTPRAYRWDIEIERPVAGGVARQAVPPVERVRPGDTIVVRERWF